MDPKRPPTLHRRSFFAAAAALLAGTSRSAPGEERARAAVAPDMQRIFDRSRLTVAVAGFALPPFITTGEEGRLAGRDIELAQGMAKALGVPVEFDRSARSFDELIDTVARGKVDLALSRLSTRLRWATQIRFSRPYLVLHEALLVNRPLFARTAKDRPPIEVLRDREAAVAVVAGTAAAEHARQLLSQARFRDYPRWDPDIVDAVLHGEVVAGYGDELEARRALGARPEAPLQLRAVVLPETRDPIAAALPWDSGQLLAWVDLYLETLTPVMTADDLLSPKPAD